MGEITIFLHNLGFNNTVCDFSPVRNENEKSNVTALVPLQITNPDVIW